MKKISAALLSYGVSGKIFHAPFLQLHHGFVLTGAWERSKRLIQQDYPALHSYPSLESILDDITIDLVVVNTPIDTHFAYAKAALDAGKHLIVEKAFTTTVAEAIALHDLAKQKNLSLSVYQNRRWDSDFKTAKSIIDHQLLGEITEAEIRFDRYNPALSPKVWKEGNNAGAGVLLDLGSHIIDQALFLFGLPQAVFADMRQVRENSLIHDNIDLLLYYTDKRVRLHAGMFNREPLPAYILQGRKGSFFKHRGDIQEDRLKAGATPNLQAWGTESLELEGLLHTEIDGEVVRKNISTLQGNYYDFYEGVYQSVTNGKPEVVSAQDGVNAMRVIEAAQQSYREQKIISLLT